MMDFVYVFRRIFEKYFWHLKLKIQKLQIADQNALSFLIWMKTDSRGL